MTEKNFRRLEEKLGHPPTSKEVREHEKELKKLHSNINKN